MQNKPILRTAFRTTLLAAIAIAASMSTSAHETMPTGWCLSPTQQPQIVQTFSFTQQQIRNMALQAEQMLGPEGLIAEGLAEREADGRCGIVDRWKMANYLAQHYCAAQTGNATAIANITGPAGFFGPNHHATYNYGGGLQGSCAICTTKTEE